jgi:hypothetical protein
MAVVVSTYRNAQKKEVVRILADAIEINSQYQALWFGVVEQAVRDIGTRRKKRAGRQTQPGGPVRYVRAFDNSDHYFAGACPDFVENSGLDWSFILRTLRAKGVLPVPADRYDGERVNANV